MKIKAIIDYIDSFAPMSSAMDFDNVGLLIGNENDEVARVLCALDITDSVVEEAKEKSCRLIISHHPIIFSPLKRIDSGDVVHKLIENNIAAVCMHTNLDLSPVFGVNTCLAKAVGVRKTTGFVDGECLYIGELDNEITNREFAQAVKDALGCKGLRYTLGEKKVQRVAICSGSGGDLAPLAKEKGADVLLTGEIKHHEILDANRLDIAIVDAGHFKSENIVIPPLCEKLREEFKNVQFIPSQTCDDFIEYL